MWRLICLILVVAVLLVFIGFNLQNTCDISFGFTTIQAVPVYFTVFASFVLGMILTLPFIISRSLKKNKTPRGGPPKKKHPGAAKGTGAVPGGDYGID